MGTLRTLFAISVVFAHSIGFVFVGGQNAVRLFYMVSGFLISYILVERKSYSTLLSFYVNRYLRLYPVYVLVALLSLFAFYIKTLFGSESNIFKIFQGVPTSATILLVFSNATMFLQDWIMFCGVKNNALVFTSNYSQSDVTLYQGLLVPQAWTLGVELEFYLIAPFILARKKLLLFFFFLSIALRFFLISIGIGDKDPWLYRFFPTELALFIIGALAHQYVLPFYKKSFSTELLDSFANIFTNCLILFTLVYWLIPINDTVKTLLLILVFFIFMPFAFLYQSKRDWDKWLGNLSYPIYISHLLVFNTVTFTLAWFGLSHELLIAGITLALTILLAITLNQFVASPIEGLRSRFRIEQVAKFK